MALFLASQNPPCRVLFEGFESDTFQLGRRGWEIALEQDNYDMKMRMILRHKSGLYGMAESLERFSAQEWHYRYYTNGRLNRDYEGLPTFVVSQVSNRMIVRHYGASSPFEGFSMVETDPEHMMVSDIELSSLPLFKAKGQPAAEDLIVDPATVSEMLEQIRQRQSPIQKEIRERARRREVIPVRHAAIYTLPQAA